MVGNPFSLWYNSIDTTEYGSAMGGRLIPARKGVSEMTVYEVLTLLVNIINLVLNLSKNKKK